MEYKTKAVVMDEAAVDRGLTRIAHEILEKSSLAEYRRERYASFDDGQGQAFAEGRLSLEDLREHAAKKGEPRQLRGKQEWVENLINDFMFG